MELSIEEYQETAIESFNSSNEIARRLALKYPEHISRYIFNSTIKEINQMDALLKNINTFNAKEVVKLTVDAVIQKIAFGPSKAHIHYAPTQSGKSAFKAVMICAYLIMNMPVIVVTKGGGESKELAGKISSYFKGSRLEDRIFSSSDVERYDNRLNIAFSNDGEASALIVLDSHQKIERSHYFLSGTMKYARERGRRIAGCALIIDEVDAVVDRSENQDEENEKAMKKLISDLKPSLVMVTATPIPVFSKYLDNKPIVTTSYEQIENYVGVKDMVLFDDLDLDSLEDGFGDGLDKFKPKFDCDNPKQCERAALFPADRIQYKNKFPNIWNKKYPWVPRINSQCIKLLRRELDKKDATGMLALVATCAKVTALGNIFDQAAGIQDYFAKGKRNLIPIVVHAAHVYYRLPGHSYSFLCSRSFSELIDEIDSNKKYGLKMPVVVFGYFGMKRSRSFRSEQRVPTCMIMSLGEGQSSENCRQAAGRLTFKGRDVLKRNRKTEKVMMLCPEDDYYLATQKYDQLVLEMIECYTEKHCSWKNLCSDLERSSSNFYLHDSKRRTGNYVPGKSNSKKQKTTVSRSMNKQSFSAVSSLSSIATESVEPIKELASDQELVDRMNFQPKATNTDPGERAMGDEHTTREDSSSSDSSRGDSSSSESESSQGNSSSSDSSRGDSPFSESSQGDSSSSDSSRGDSSLSDSSDESCAGVEEPSGAKNAVQQPDIPKGVAKNAREIRRCQHDEEMFKDGEAFPENWNRITSIETIERSVNDHKVDSTRYVSSLSDSSNESCLGEEEPWVLLKKPKELQDETAPNTAESRGWQLESEALPDNWHRITSIETIERSANDH